jgi:SH3 domain protein
MANRIIPGLILILSLSTVFAQDESSDDRDRQYVTDQLRLSLYEEPDSSSQVVRLLQSGDLLEIEQLQGPYALVTAPDGSRGWVKRGFLVSKPTSNLLLRDAQNRNVELTAEVEKLSNSKLVIEQYEQDMNKLVERIDALERDKTAAERTIEALRLEIETRQREIEEKQQVLTPPFIVLWETAKTYWDIVVPIALVIVLISFLVSKMAIEARIKARFHGIKIW